jgi:hypothetical protein
VPDFVIPVTADTHARFFAQADELNLSSDAYIRLLLGLDKPYGQFERVDENTVRWVPATMWPEYVA